MKNLRRLLSVLSLVALAAVSRAQSYAPSTNIGNTSFIGTITGSTGGANGDGAVNDFFTANGQDYTVTQSGAFTSPVSYTYTNTGANTGTITEGSLSVALTFTTPTAGTFVATYSPGVAQTGTFTINTAGYATALSNVSCLTTIAAGSSATAGFYVSGGVPRMVLVRAIGPGLAQFGVTGTLSAPSLTLWNGGTTIMTGTSTTSALASVYAAVGAFAVPTGGADQALVATLNPGAYTAMVTGSASGKVLIEVYYLN